MVQKNIFQRLAMPLPELEQYYREQRRIRFEYDEPFRGVKLRKTLHPILVCGLKLMHLVNGQKITVLGDKRTPTDRPVIFAATHIGWDDIEMIFTAIRDHAYLFWGDPRESYKTIDGMLLDLNGAVICDTDNKTDRYIGKETCVRWLEQGGNLLIFPEGVWNTSENLPVQYLFPGTAEMAIRTNADIIPVAISQFGKEYRVNIGANISCNGFCLSQKQALTNYLRDAMATLKWEIYETQSLTKRNSIPDNYAMEYKQIFLDQAQGVYTWEFFVNTAYRPKNITTSDEAFIHLDQLIPCRENAFLFRKI